MQAVVAIITSARNSNTNNFIIYNSKTIPLFLHPPVKDWFSYQLVVIHIIEYLVIGNQPLYVRNLFSRNVMCNQRIL